MTQVAGGLGGVHDLFERHFLVLVGAETRLTNAREHLAHGRIARQGDAKRQRVHEQADQRLGLGAAVRNGGANDHVVLAAVARQQDRNA